MENNIVEIDGWQYDRRCYSDEEWGSLIANAKSITTVELITSENALEKYSDLLNPEQIESLKNH